MAKLKYLLMQMKFSKDCDYRYSSDCGIEKSSFSYKPKFLGHIFGFEDYKDAYNFVIDKNETTKGRKYDILHYLVPYDKEKFGDKLKPKKEFLERYVQEEYMSDFFNDNKYLKTLKDSNVLDKCKNLKDLDECIHTKFCYLEPSDYNMLGFPCLDIDSLEDMESSIDTIALDIIVADFDTNLEELEDGIDKEDLEKLKSELSNLDKTVSSIKEHICKIKTKIDDDGFYINKK